LKETGAITEGGVFAGADIDGVWVGGIECDAAVVEDGEFVGEGEPDDATVDGFPDATGGRGDIDDIGIGGMGCDGDDTSAGVIVSAPDLKQDRPGADGEPV